MKSTRFYDQHAEALCEQYCAIAADDVHGKWMVKHLPEKPGFACDIGAGSGRDANWLATKGWDVIAVEPGTEMRRVARGRTHPRVTWLDDALPHLHKLRALGHRFDLVLLSAVWMHVPPTARERAFRIVSELLKPSGILVITLRHGSDEQENAERGFREVSADEVLEYAKRRAVALTGASLNLINRVVTSPGKHWCLPCPTTAPVVCPCSGILSSTITSRHPTNWVCCAC